MIRVLKFEGNLLLRTILSDRPVKIAIIVLGLLIFSMVVLYVATAGHPVSSLSFNVHRLIGLSKDRSLGEILNYGQAFLASFLFFVIFLESRSLMFLSLSVLMAFIWFDDAAKYHERFGGILVEKFDLPVFGALRAQDTGELIAWAIAGIIFICFFWVSLLRPRPGDLGAFTLVSVGFLALILFGIIVDMVHIAAPQDLNFIIGVIEDGGEMLAITSIAAVALGCVRNYEAYCQALASAANRPRNQSGNLLSD